MATFKLSDAWSQGAASGNYYLRFWKIVPRVDMTVTGFVIPGTVNAGYSLRAGLFTYTSDSKVGSFLAQATVTTSGTSAATQSVNFSSGGSVTLKAGTTYQLGVGGISGQTQFYVVSSPNVATDALADLDITGYLGNTTLTAASDYSTIAGTSISTDTGYPDVGLVYTTNAGPNPPTHANIGSGGGTYNRRPKFFCMVNHPNGTQVTDVWVQVAALSDFSTLSFSHKFSEGYGGWSGMPANSGGQVTWTVPDSWVELPAGTWYIRWSAMDSKGVWSAWSAVMPFTVKQVPDGWNLLNKNQRSVEYNGTVGFNPATGGGTPAPTLSRDVSVARTGSASLKIVGTAAQSGQGTFLDRVSGNPTGTYTFSAYVKGMAGDVVYATLEEWDASTGGTQQRIVTGSDVTLTGGWDRVSVKATLTGYGWMVGTIRHRLAQAFTIWVDDFEISSDPIIAGQTGFKAQWLNEIRDCLTDIWNFRGGFGAVPLRDNVLSNVSEIRAQHIMDRRMCLSYLLSKFSAVTPVWTDVQLTNLLDVDQALSGDAFGSVSGFLGYNATAPVHDYANGTGLGSVMVSRGALDGAFSIHTGGRPTSVVGGRWYSAEGVVRTAPGRQLRPTIWFFDQDLKAIQAVDGANRTATGAFDVVGVYSAQAPANAAFAWIEIYNNTAQSGDSLWWDCGYLVEGTPTMLDRNTQHIIELRNCIMQA